MEGGGGCPFGFGGGSRREETQPNGIDHEDEVDAGTDIGARKPGEVYYSEYLQLDKLLNIQKLRSVEIGAPAHDEMLFIVIHQVYELWFKQIIHELDLVISIFQQVPIPERDVAKANHHLERVIKIQKLLIEQIQVIETMSPLDFLDFRDLLYPASGFQSYQFRLVENKMGMLPERRLKFQCSDYHKQLSKEHAEIVQKAESQPTLFSAVEGWLERIPFLVDEEAGFHFWDVYKNSAAKMFEEERQRIEGQTVEGSKARAEQMEDWENSKNSFFALLDEELHETMMKKGQRRLSFKATQAALLITLYRDEPLLAAPWGLLNHLIDLDNGMQHWRHRHSVMAHRMIGTKMGTGGSSGYYYLKATLQRGRVFDEISNLSTYLLPKRHLPTLPDSLLRKLNFQHDRVF